MTQSVIPPSPSREDYAAQLEANADESLFDRDEPIALFVEWLEDARASEPNDPNAMALATVDVDGHPDVRMVLLKDVDTRGFTFFSNQESAKGGQLWSSPSAALLFHWKSLRRQVRVRGPVEPVSVEEADAYFASRARESRIGAWVSDQSRPLADRATLERRGAEQTARVGGAGWRVKPVQIEFWRDRPFRLHDRLRFDRATEDQPWRRSRLWP